MDIVDGTIGFKNMLDGILSNVTWMLIKQKVWSRSGWGERYLQTSNFRDVDMGVSKNRGTPNGWFIMDNPTKMDDLGVPLFLETPIL